MKLIRLIASASMAGIFSLALVGAAAADDATLDTTGPNSNNQITIDNSVTVEQTNKNNVQVDNVNLQEASSGDVAANNNTTTGDLGSGAASNNSSATTTVSINNSAPDVLGTGGQGGGGAGGFGNGGSSGGLGASGSGASTLGAATSAGFGAGVETLPVVGPSQPVDVSALRAAWPPKHTTAGNLAQRTSAISTMMLIVAALLSLIGAVASSVYARRQERRA
jgi:hypothetical protein